MCVMGTVRMNAQTGFTPVQGLTAYDNVGRRIGNVVGFGAANNYGYSLGYPNVALSKDGTTILLGLTKNSFFGNWYLVFTTSDCTGTAYFEQLSTGDIPLTPSVVHAGAVFIPDTGAPPPIATIKREIVV